MLNWRACPFKRNFSTRSRGCTSIKLDMQLIFGMCTLSATSIKSGVHKVKCAIGIRCVHLKGASDFLAYKVEPP